MAILAIFIIEIDLPIILNTKRLNALNYSSITK